MGRFKSTIDAVQCMQRLCRLGGHPQPAWVEAWSDVETRNLLANFKPTKAPNQRWPKLQRIEYPEDRLVQSYYARHPEARDQLVVLNSFEPPPARVFAWRQLRLMRERGLTRRQAQRAVEAREAQEGAKRQGPGKRDLLVQIQEQEERALINALNRRAGR